MKSRVRVPAGQGWIGIQVRPHWVITNGEATYLPICPRSMGLCDLLKQKGLTQSQLTKLSEVGFLIDILIEEKE